MNEPPRGAPEDRDDPDAGGDPEALDRQRILGSRLRTIFDDVVEEPVPDAFVSLLDRLDGAENS